LDKYALSTEDSIRSTHLPSSAAGSRSRSHSTINPSILSHSPSVPETASAPHQHQHQHQHQHRQNIKRTERTRTHRTSVNANPNPNPNPRQAAAPGTGHCDQHQTTGVRLANSVRTDHWWLGRPAQCPVPSAPTPGRNQHSTVKHPHIYCGMVLPPLCRLLTQ
jgi:hypothetical protein